MKIGIVGAGLSGLTCAWYLKKNGFEDVTLFDSAEKAGGKVNTDYTDGYYLDRGFQVLLPSYPETKKILDYQKLKLQKFDKGSLVLKNGFKIPFYDPENGWIAVLKTVLNGPGNFLDKILLLKLKFALSRLSVEQIFNNNKTISSLEYLKAFGFSEKIINDFWIPFYQGVFLENVLETDSKMLQFTFKMFAEGGAAIPHDGMEAIPRQLVDYIGMEKIHLNTKVNSFSSASITLIDGKQLHFDKVVVACNLNQTIKYQSVTNKYFETDKLPISTKHIILNANPNRIVNNVAFISNVAPNYSKNGKYLISVSANGIYPEADVFMKDLVILFGKEAQNWQLVKSYIIKEALPKINFEEKHSFEPINGVFHCSDYLLQGSINGAMESGRRTAEAIIKRA